MKQLTQERLKELLHYDYVTGIFVWKIARQGIQVGGTTGYVNKLTGYMQIRVEGKAYYAHRLAWFYVHGVWPKGEIHHINCTTTDNRITNLEDTTSRGNNSNRKCHREGHLVGTTFNKRLQKWVSQIETKGKNRYLGLYDTDIEAHEMYKKALKELI